MAKVSTSSQASGLLPANEVMLAIAILGLLEDDNWTTNGVLEKCQDIVNELIHQGVGTDKGGPP